MVAEGNSKTVARACACGCERAVEGERSTRLYYSATCRKRAERKRNGGGVGVGQESMQTLHGTERTGTGARSVRQYGHVTVSDAQPVFCAGSGCGGLVAGLEGPLPVPVYCGGCVAKGACD